MGGFTHNPLNKKISRKGIHGDFYQCVLLYISFQKNINLLCLATCLGFVDITWTTANGKDLKSSNVFTAIKSIKKHEAELHTQSKVPPIVAVMPPSNDVLDSRLFTNAGVNYVNDTLQVNVCNIIRVLVHCLPGVAI